MNKKIIKQLAEIVGVQHVSDDPIELMVHSRDASPLFEEFPVVVVRPGTAQEVSEVLGVANKNNIRVITKTGATTPWGASVPRQKGLMIIQMGRMNRVLDIDENAMVVTVEAGCTWTRLERTINPRGWRVGVMPHSCGMSSGVAGNITAGSGTSQYSAKFGLQIDNIMGLEVVLPNGSIIKTGSGAIDGAKQFDKNSGTPADITGLFWGSAGMFGILTQVTLRMYAMPVVTQYQLHAFETPSAAQRMIYRVQKNDIASGLFFFSRESVATTGWPLPIAHLVTGSIEGSNQTEVDGKAETYRTIARDEGGQEIKDIGAVLGAIYTDKLMRYTFGNETYFPGGGRFCLNTAFPIMRLEEYLSRTAVMGKKHGINPFGVVFIAKNTLYGLQYFPYYEREPEQRRKALAAGAEAMEANAAAGMGSWCMAGILAPAFYSRMNKNTFAFIESIKKAVDPNNIMVAPWEN